MTAGVLILYYFDCFYQNLEASIATKNGNEGGSDSNGGNRRMSIFGRIGKKGEDGNK